MQGHERPHGGLSGGRERTETVAAAVADASGSLAQETALELEAEVGVALDAVAAQMLQDDPVGLARAAGREGREPAAGGRGQAGGKRKRGHGGLLPGEWVVT